MAEWGFASRSRPFSCVVDKKVYVFVVYELLFVNTVVVIGHARGPVLFASFGSHGPPVNIEKNAESLVSGYIWTKKTWSIMFFVVFRTQNTPSEKITCSISPG